VKALKPSVITLSILLLVIFFCYCDAQARDVVESSYHGQLGRSPSLGGWGNGLGMLEKWDAFNNFSFEKQGRIRGFKEHCGECHTSSYRDPATGKTDCLLCHKTKDGKGKPTVAQCAKCHELYGRLKRGDIVDEEHDVHMAIGMRCHDCHERLSDKSSDHQFAKGYAIDTTEDTVEGALSCIKCHEEKPHGRADEGDILDSRHVTKIACITCHAGPRPAEALKSRNWNKFTEDGKPVTEMRKSGWIAENKWYIGKKLGHFPILEATDLMAKIHPFNEVTFTWFVKSGESTLDDIITIPEVRAADADKDGETTIEEMRKYKKEYKEATLVTRKFNYSVSHSVVPSDKAFSCDDCHGKSGRVIDWKELGYAYDPYE
jgi:methanogenesis multiheme c-type cytochrome